MTRANSGSPSPARANRRRTAARSIPGAIERRDGGHSAMVDDYGTQTRCPEGDSLTRIGMHVNAWAGARAISCASGPQERMTSGATPAQRHLPSLRRAGRNHRESLRCLCSRVAGHSRALRHLRSERDSPHRTMPYLHGTPSTGRSYRLRTCLCTAGRLPRPTTEVSPRPARRPGTGRAARARRDCRDRDRLACTGTNHPGPPAKAGVQPGTRNRARPAHRHRSTAHAGGAPAPRHGHPSIVPARHDCAACERCGCIPGMRTDWRPCSNRRRCGHHRSDRERACPMSEVCRRQPSRRLGSCPNTLESE